MVQRGRRKINGISSSNVSKLQLLQIVFSESHHRHFIWMPCTSVLYFRLPFTVFIHTNCIPHFTLSTVPFWHFHAVQFTVYPKSMKAELPTPKPNLIPWSWPNYISKLSHPYISSLHIMSLCYTTNAVNAPLSPCSIVMFLISLWWHIRKWHVM